MAMMSNAPTYSDSYSSKYNADIQANKTALAQEQQNLQAKQNELKTVENSLATNRGNIRGAELEALNGRRNQLQTELDGIKYEIDQYNNAIRQLEAKLSQHLNVYTRYGKEYQTQQINPISTTTQPMGSVGDIENIYATKQQNIGTYQQAITGAEQAQDTSKLQQDIQAKQAQINQQLQDRKYWDDAFNRLQVNNEPWTPEETNTWKQIGPKRNQINGMISQLQAEKAKLEEVLSQKQQEGLKAKQDINQYQSGIGEQKTGMDDLRIQRERYASALQQGRVRNKVMGTSQNFLKGLR